MQRLLATTFVLAAVALGSGPSAAQVDDKFLGKSAAEWQAKLTDKDAAARANAAFALGKIGNRASGALLELAALVRNEKDPAVRDASALAIGAIAKRGTAQKGIIDALCSAVATDSTYVVKRSAAIALGQCAADLPEVVSVLEKAIEDRSAKATGLRQNATWALGEICERSGKPPVATLRKALNDGDKLVKRDAAIALGKLQAKDAARAAVPDLVACITHDYLELRKAACFTLVELVEPGDTKAMKALAKICRDPKEDIEVRRNAALALSNIGGEDVKAAVPLLLEMLRGNDLDLKKRAALSFRNTGEAGKVAQADLIELLRSNDGDLRHNAAVALGGIQSASAVPELVLRIADQKEKEGVRVACCVALREIGDVKDAKAAVPQLIAVLENPKEPVFVRERILWALRVHKAGLLHYDRLFVALKQILAEPGLQTALSSQGNQSGKMLRYDAAFLLCVLRGQDAPQEVLPVLNDFLRDDGIRKFDRLGSDVGGRTKEKLPGGKDNVTELGSDDGRILAIKALEEVGYDRVRQNKEIMAQLIHIRDANGFAKNIQEASELLLARWGVK